ncbi:MAG: cupin domain-containing protein [Gemmatimonas sp.]
MAVAPPLQQTARLDAELAKLNVEGHWTTNRDGLPPEPRAFEPCLWRWREIYPRIIEAGETLGIEGGASRRTLRLCTPGVPGKATTPTIHTSLQMVKPGEVAEAHRHSIGAFRFVVQGAGAYTTVDGERFVMEPHDLVLTPQMTWHDHGNESAEPIIWIDGHDVPLLKSLNLLFFETYNSTTQQVTKPEGAARSRAGLRPRGDAGATAGAPYIYKGAEALALLRSLGPDADDPYDARTLDYANPFTGGPTLPTIACALHLLQPGQRTRTHRHTASTVYHVVEGRGSSRIGDKTFQWEPGDMFVVPNWAWHSHAVADAASAILFSVSDEPVLAALSHSRAEDAPESP